MKILVLLKGDQRDEFILQYARDMFSQENAEFHLLNIVSVNDEVPLDMKGQVLKNCTEFDLSGYHKQAQANLQELNKLQGDDVAGAHALVGNRLVIVEKFAEDNQIEFVVGGARQTSAMEDAFSSSFASRVLEAVKVPYLTVKCEHPDFKMNRIALVREFQSPKQENLGFLKRILEQFDAKLLLVKIKASSEAMSNKDILLGMDEFLNINGLEGDKLIVTNDDKEGGLRDLIEDHNIDMLALGKMRKAGFFHFFGAEVRAQIVNHIKAPIVIY